MNVLDDILRRTKLGTEALTEAYVKVLHPASNVAKNRNLGPAEGHRAIYKQPFEATELRKLCAKIEQVAREWIGDCTQEQHGRVE